MTSAADSASPPSPPSAALAAAWLAQSHDLLVLTDAAARIVWCNAAFERASGIGARDDLLSLAPTDWLGGTPRERMQMALQSGTLSDAALALRARSGATLWVQARHARVGEHDVWTLQDRTAQQLCEQPDAAHSLDATAAQLKLIADLGNIVVWRHDLKTDRVQYNQRGYDLLGLPYRADGLALADVRAPTHPEDVPTIIASAQRSLESSEPQDIEVRYRRPDGSWRYRLQRRVVERDAAGAAIAFAGISLDVTERVEQARRAEHLALRLEAAAEAAQVGIWTATIGTELTEWNERMYELFDRVGASGPPTLREWLDECVHPDDRSRVGQALRAYARDRPAAFEIEFRARRRDERTRWLMLRADVDRASTDNARVFGIAMDVTERHEALAALHAASERAALIARHAGIGTWEADPHGLLAIWDEQMFRLRGIAPGAAPLDAAQRLELVHPDDRGAVLDTSPELNAGVQPSAYEFRVRWPDGSYRWLASRSAPLFDEHGEVLRRVGVNWDITEAKNVELAQRQAALAERESRAKSQFMSRMSHELRTPLNAVLGFTQLLQLDAQRSGATDRLGKLGHIRAAGEHLLTLVNDTLDLSSLEAGTLTLALQPVALASAITQAVALVAATAAAQGVVVHTGRLEGTARADPARLRQVLQSLLTHAIASSRSGGHVTIEATSRDDRARFSVRDTGRGMLPEQLVHLFEPFNRLGVGGDPNDEGPGLGLTIARALVEGMRGHIGASSQPGQGTVFEVTLPAIAPAAPPTHGAAPAHERSGQLLYIEDNSVNVLLVEELVKSVPGLRIASEPTGAAGVARARSLRPDLILIDMQLPDFDGFEVLRQLRAQPDTAGIPCIALSANAMPEDVARGLASGFDDYWTKPIKFKAFLDALTRLFPITTV